MGKGQSCLQKRSNTCKIGTLADSRDSGESRQHTAYPGNNICQKCGGKNGLWVLHKISNKTYAENMKKIVGAVWELLAK